MSVAIGVDSHKATFTAAAVDALGKPLGDETFRNDSRGFTAFEAWVDRFGDRMIGIEGSQRYGQPLAHRKQIREEQVFEVPALLTARERRRQRNKGKSDRVDAYAIARAVARGEGLADPARDAVCIDLKLLVDYRDQLIHTRTELCNQTHQDLVVLMPGYQERIPKLTSAKNLSAAITAVRGDRSLRAGLVRRRVAEIRRLDAEIAKADKEVAAKLEQSGTTLMDIPGVGPFVAARVLGEIGDPARIRSKAAFAIITGTAPLEVSSGGVKRHRLNRQGNRQLNHALFVVAMTQARIHPEARAYMERKRTEGKSYREALRCLKRQLAGVIYRRLQEDSRRLAAAA